MARLDTVKGRQLYSLSKAFGFRSAGSKETWIIQTSRTLSNNHLKEFSSFHQDGLIVGSSFAHALKDLSGQQDVTRSHSSRWIASWRRNSSQTSCLRQHLQQEEGWIRSLRSARKPGKGGGQGHLQAHEVQAPPATQPPRRARSFHSSAAGLTASPGAAEAVAAEAQEEEEEAALSAEGLQIRRTPNPQLGHLRGHLGGGAHSRLSASCAARPPPGPASARWRTRRPSLAVQGLARRGCGDAACATLTGPCVGACSYVTERLAEAPLPPLSSLSFGRVYTDHMLHAAWARGRGWGTPAVEPLGALPLHPCAQVLHYAMECFEGLKAYRGVDGRVRLFRPGLNMARMQRSAKRLALPTFSEAAWLSCLKSLLRVDESWVPREEGYALYVRPTLISTTPFLGVGPPTEALLYAVMSPVGPYFPTGLKPIALWAEQTRARACYGGVGDCKVGGNYAPTIAPLVEAHAHGCQQVLFLHRTPKAAYIGECGAMNMFFLLQRPQQRGGPSLELVTPPLDGLILPGVTRDSVLSLCRTWGEFEVSERHVTMEEVQRASREERLLEVFGTGTACVIQPVSSIRWEGTELRVPFDDAACAHWMGRVPGTAVEASGVGEPLSLAGRLTRALLDIQHAHYPSPWSEPID